MQYSAMAQSKMIRAGLVFASGKANKNISNKSLLNLATSVELMHTYSLIHDDLPSMDNDDFRRGKKSSHKKFGEANAILAGDAIQPMAYYSLTNSKEIEDKHKVSLVSLLAEACGQNGMVEGQILDISENIFNKTNVISQSFGGGPIFGINGIAIIGHGSSQVSTIVNAIKTAKLTIENNWVEKQQNAIKKIRLEIKD